MELDSLRSKVDHIISDTKDTVEKRLYRICELLEANVLYYNWVGFYFRNGTREELKLGPYVGMPTDHDIIPFGKGICGQVAVSDQNFVVPDVNAQDNYLACSATVKAEIVIPIFIDGKNIGQIDIDSDTLDPFTESDVRFLEYVSGKVAQIL
jgi:GAF domain-containing protein